MGADFNAQDISMSVWAIAKAGVQDPEFFQALCDYGMAKVADFNTQELSNIMWAVAKAGVQAPEFFQALCNQGKTKIADFNAQELLMSMWAVDKAGVQAPEFFRALCKQGKTKIARTRSSSPASSTRVQMTRQRSSSVSGRTGAAVLEVLEVRSVVKPNKENLFDLLKAYTPGCPVERYEGPKAYARVHVVEEHAEYVQDLIKQFGRQRGNKEVKVTRVQINSA